MEDYPGFLVVNDSGSKNATNKKTEELEKLFENFINKSETHFDEIEKRINDQAEISNKQKTMNEKTEELTILFESFVNSSETHFDEIEKRMNDQIEISNR